MIHDASNGRSWVSHSGHSDRTDDGQLSGDSGNVVVEREWVVGSSAEVVCDGATAERQGREAG